jgi:putative iron-dependent peroxidase
MAEAQTGILPEPSAHARFLVVRVSNPGGNASSVARAIARMPGLGAKVAALDRRARLVSTVSIGPELWDAISPGRRPRGLRPFAAIEAGRHRAPSTGGDLLLHIVSQRADLNFELAQRALGELGDTVAVMDDVTGFRYLDGRDLTGFIDGSENPKGKQRAVVALIGAEDRDFAGGSFVFTQRYVHDLTTWALVPLREQEGAVGRRKRDSKELSDRVKPPTAHIRRVVIEENGQELEIVRHSFPYGTVVEAGLFFIAYTKSLDIPERMLRRMLGVAGDGLHDHLMDFTRAVTGAHFFAPSLRTLRALGRT